MNAYHHLADCEAGNACPPTLPGDAAEPLTDDQREEMLRNEPWAAAEHDTAPRGPWWRQFGGTPDLLAVLVIISGIVGAFALALLMSMLMKGPM